jgi:uncharacterized membrane protein
MTTILDQPLQTRVDAYLMRLRRSLGELPPEEVNEILREIRSHILDRAEASGELTDDKLARILKELGQPEDIGPLYQAEAMVARARSSFSPLLILRTTIRWAMMSIVGFITFILGLLGYGLALGFIFCAMAKPFMWEKVGLWVHSNGFTMGTISATENGHELMGWWIIPFGLIVGPVFLIGTTRFLRWMLRYASRKHLPVLRVERVDQTVT